MGQIDRLLPNRFVGEAKQSNLDPCLSNDTITTSPFYVSESVRLDKIFTI